MRARSATRVKRGSMVALPHTNHYVLTFVGRRIALFFTKAYARVLRRGLARLDVAPPHDADDELATAWQRLDNALDHLVADARLIA